jgi:hypothetical protein
MLFVGGALAADGVDRAQHVLVALGNVMVVLPSVLVTRSAPMRTPIFFRRRREAAHAQDHAFDLARGRGSDHRSIRPSGRPC